LLVAELVEQQLAQWFVLALMVRFVRLALRFVRPEQQSALQQ
jgi:hypothetical protein